MTLEAGAPFALLREGYLTLQVPHVGVLLDHHGAIVHDVTQGTPPSPLAGNLVTYPDDWFEWVLKGGKRPRRLRRPQDRPWAFLFWSSIGWRANRLRLQAVWRQAEALGVARGTWSDLERAAFTHFASL